MVMGQIISESSGISLGLLVSLVAVFVAIAGTLVSILWSIRGKLSKLVIDFKRLEQEQWTIANQCEYALRMKIANQSLRIPDPRDQSKNLGDE